MPACRSRLSIIICGFTSKARLSETLQSSSKSSARFYFSPLARHLAPDSSLFAGHFFSHPAYQVFFDLYLDGQELVCCSRDRRCRASKKVRVGLVLSAAGSVVDQARVELLSERQAGRDMEPGWRKSFTRLHVCCFIFSPKSRQMNNLARLLSLQDNLVSLFQLLISSPCPDESNKQIFDVPFVCFSVFGTL